MSAHMIEAQIAEWRRHVSASPAMNGHDLDELEDHLRDQIAELGGAGLSGEEAFLIAVKRMGDVDAISREFAREHSDRLWKQLVLSSDSGTIDDSRQWIVPIAFAVAAAVVVQIAIRLAGFPDAPDSWLIRNLTLLVLPFLAAYFAYDRRLDLRGWLMAASPFVAAALIVNLYPLEPESAIEVLVALHLPVVLWFAVFHPYAGGAVGSHDRRMDFVRFTGEWFIYYVLIALGGGVLMGLTSLVLEPIDPDLGERVFEWLLPSGAAGAVIVAAWLVESKQRVIENMAPVLTMVFSPLFAVMLSVAAVTYAVSGVAADFDRELLGLFDVLMVVVLALVLYAISARDGSRPGGLMDVVQIVAVVAALVLDVMVLASMLARVGELGFTPNRVAALGLNLVLLVNLAGSAWLLWGFLRRGTPMHRLERWQTSYLPVFAVWGTVVVVIVPLLFGFA